MTGEDLTRVEEASNAPTESGTASGDRRLSVDEAVRLFTNQRRRAMLRHLMNQSDGTATVDDLVDLVTAAETSSVDHRRDRERITIDIQCIQLPYLTDAGVVEHEPAAGRVRYRAHPRLEALLSCLDREYQ